MNSRKIHQLWWRYWWRWRSPRLVDQSSKHGDDWSYWTSQQENVPKDSKGIRLSGSYLLLVVPSINLRQLPDMKSLQWENSFILIMFHTYEEVLLWFSIVKFSFKRKFLTDFLPKKIAMNVSNAREYFKKWNTLTMTLIKRASTLWRSTIGI